MEGGDRRDGSGDELRMRSGIDRVTVAQRIAGDSDKKKATKAEGFNYYHHKHRIELMNVKR